MSTETKKKLEAGEEEAEQPPAALAETATLAEGADLARTTPMSASKGADHAAPQRGHRHRYDDADELVGRQLEHFEISSTLGSGGMGSVYRARDVSLERTVALKVLPNDFNEPRLIKRFKREARAQARLSHPNVVPIYFIGEQDGRHFFAMELVDGDSLDAVLESHERLAWLEALDHMIDVAKALRQAHHRGLIHRDLKPGNLLVSADGTIKVADFGLAKPMEEGAGNLTQEGTFLGTPLYIAPEQARSQDIDHRADMYALGATFFHLLSGEPLFSAPTPMAVAIKHVSEPAPHIEECVDELPSQFAAIFRRLLAKEPDARFADYDELIDALEAARPTHEPRAGFLVRSLAWGVDMIAVGLLAFAHEWAPLVVYPVYVIGAWTLDWGTLGQWFFRLRVQHNDDSPLTLSNAVKRFAVMHWGAAAFGILWASMHFGFGIESIQIDNGEVLTPGDHLTQLTFAGLFGVTLVFWAIGGMIAAVHPRKRALQDMLCDTKVTYRLDGAPNTTKNSKP